MQPKKTPDFSKPYMYTEYDDQIAAAVQAVAEGKANQGQQMLAFDWIMNSLCGYYDLSYRPSSDRDTSFAEGKRFVAAQLVKMTRMKIGRLGGNHEI
jgi:hypothetical protein